MAEKHPKKTKSDVRFENIPKEFSLNGTEIKRRMKRIIALLGFAILILCAIKLPAYFQQYFGPLAFPLLAALISVLFYFLTKYALTKVKLEVTFTNGKFKFPYYYIWFSEYPISSIFSSEELNVNESAETIIVGFKGGSSVYFEKKIFSNEMQFYEFRKSLLEFANLNSGNELSKKIYIVEHDTSHVFVQIVIILIWVTIFLLLSLYFNKNFESILEEGAVSRRSILEGEYFRLFSSFFLHSSFTHVAANVLLFSALSQSILRLVDISKYLNILLITSLFASCFTLLVHPDEFVVGASGGVFGLFGAFCAVKMSRKLPGSVSFISDLSVYLLIGIEIVYGVLNDRIDLYSHVGGFFAGFLILRSLMKIKHSQSMYSSSFGGKLIAIFLSVAFLGGLISFLSQIYVELA